MEIQYGFIEDEPTATPLKVLIRFHHGLGDTVQLGVVLKHLRKYRPNWTVDVWCGQGKHTALICLCNRVWHDRENPQPVISDYDRVVEPGFWETRDHAEGCPNTKAVSTLKEVFGIAWDKELGRYEFESWRRIPLVERYLVSIGAKLCDDGFAYKLVTLHTQGNTSATRKDLPHWIVDCLCEQIIAAGRIPIILDWDKRSPLPDNKRIFCPGIGKDDLWGGFGSGDAATIAALIQLSEAFIGIDSGPGKIASATDTPSLICWHGHHPMHFQDPAPNTIHLVPHTHWKMEPLSDRVRPDLDGPCDYPAVRDWFLNNYNVLTYENDMHGLLWETQKWLASVLGQPVPEKKIAYVLPTGIGDSVWALHKIRAVNRKVNPCPHCDNGWQLSYMDETRDVCASCRGDASGPIDIILCGDPQKAVDHRAVPFLKRFSFIRSVKVLDIPVLRNIHRPADEQGRYVYQPDGFQGNHYFLTPNHALERGVKLADWLPEFPIDWDVMREFSWKDTENGHDVEIGKFVAFYLGPMEGNTNEGHNRGPIWTPFDWVSLGASFQALGYQIAVVGADYDRSYWEQKVKPHCSNWVDLIGQFEIGETFAFLQHAACLISYQCGLGIVHHYLGGKVVLWWRPDGDSIHPDRKICFSESMADGWCNPAYRDNYLPLLYGEQNGAELFEMIKTRGWV